MTLERCLHNVRTQATEVTQTLMFKIHYANHYCLAGRTRKLICTIPMGAANGQHGLFVHEFQDKKVLQLLTEA